MTGWRSQRPEKDAPRSLRGKSGRKSGGQHGHKGTTLKQVATPDALVHHYPHQCTRCSATLSPEAATGFSVRQVFGLAPPPPLFITEHRAHTCLCRACGTLVRADFPETVKAPAQYSDEIAALAAYLQTQHCIPEDRLARIFSDLYKIRIAPATLASLIAKKADSLRIFADRVRELLSGVAVKHLDETGFRIAGKTRWLHMLCSTSLSHLRLGTGRGDIPSDWQERSFTIAGHPIWRWRPWSTVFAMRICSESCRPSLITTRNLGRRI